MTTMLALLLWSTLAQAHAPGATSTPCGLVQPTDPVLGEPSYDCTQSQDTGYDAGEPFDITVVTIDGEPVELGTANAFWVMREAAAQDGVDIRIVSGFRTMAEQEYFYMCYECCCCNNCNLAAAPGYSNHQSGHALDLNASAPGVYNWLAAHGGEYGFSETVPSENWHWEWWGGGPGGGICDIAAPPAGVVDAAACEGIVGWAQDPDSPEAAIEVRVGLGAPVGDPAAVTLSTVANLERADLCRALGSCAHGFELEVPLLLRDGISRAVHVVAIDDAGEANTTIAAGESQLSCPRPPLPTGVLRAVDDATLAGWGMSLLDDGMRVTADELGDFDDGPALGAVALLVRASDDDTTWWIDDGWRREVSEAAAAAWRIDLASAQIVEPAILDQWREGTPMRARPELLTDDTAVFLVDDSQAAGGGSGGDGGGDGPGDDGSVGDGSSDGSGSGDDGLAVPEGEHAPAGCGCRTEGGARLGLAWIVIGGLALARRRRG